MRTAYYAAPVRGVGSRFGWAVERRGNRYRYTLQLRFILTLGDTPAPGPGWARLDPACRAGGC